jgi:hypothetical protein
MSYVDYIQLFREYDNKIEEMIEAAHNFREMLIEIAEAQLTNPQHLLWIAYQTRVKLNDVKLREVINIINLLPNEMSQSIKKKYHLYQNTKKPVNFTYIWLLLRQPFDVIEFPLENDEIDENDETIVWEEEKSELFFPNYTLL